MNQPITHQDWWGLNQIQGSKDVGIEIRGTHANNIKRHFKITNYKKALSVNKRSWGTLSLARGSLYFLTRAQTGCVPVSRSLSRILGKQMSNNWPRSAGHQSVGARALHLAMIESCLNLNFQFSSVYRVNIKRLFLFWTVDATRNTIFANKLYECTLLCLQ